MTSSNRFMTASPMRRASASKLSWSWMDPPRESTSWISMKSAPLRMSGRMRKNACRISSVGGDAGSPRYP